MIMVTEVLLPHKLISYERITKIYASDTNACSKVAKEIAALIN